MKLAPLTLAWRIEANVAIKDLLAEAYTRIPGELTRQHANLIGAIDWHIDAAGTWPRELDSPYGVLVARATIRRVTPGTREGWEWHHLNNTPSCLPCSRAHTRTRARAVLIS